MIGPSEAKPYDFEAEVRVVLLLKLERYSDTDGAVDAGGAEDAGGAAAAGAGGAEGAGIVLPAILDR